MQANKVLFTLCARNGSKGVVNKNVRNILNKPLIMYTIEFLQKCDFKTHLVVSTDGNPISNVVKNDVDWVHQRPSELAGDTVARWPVLIDVVEACEKKYSIEYDYIFDFLGTAPLRRSEDLDACYQMVQKDDVDNVVTAVPSHRNPYFNMLQIKPSRVNPEIICKAEKEITRRQDAPETYDMNGSIYAWKRESLFSSSQLLNRNTRLHVMPELTSVDVDTEKDFEFLEFLIKKHGIPE